MRLGVVGLLSLRRVLGDVDINGGARGVDGGGIMGLRGAAQGHNTAVSARPRKV